VVVLVFMPNVGLRFSRDAVELMAVGLKVSGLGAAMPVEGQSTNNSIKQNGLSRFPWLIFVCHDTTETTGPCRYLVQESFRNWTANWLLALVLYRTVDFTA